MSGDFSVPVSIPVDGDGFLRRECPTCEGQFKWFAHQEGDPNAEHVDQYFCPLCGVPSGPGSWWTPEQIEYATNAAGPAIDQYVQDAMTESFKGIKGLEFKPSSNFSLGLPTPSALIEPNDMVIAEPPCHPNEPVKVPEEVTSRIHCLVCGVLYAV